MRSLLKLYEYTYITNYIYYKFYYYYYRYNIGKTMIYCGIFRHLFYFYKLPSFSCIYVPPLSLEVPPFPISPIR